MIRTTDEDGVRTVTIDRPERRNALVPDDLDALRAAVAEADAPVVVLRGAGSAFCAGADLDMVADLDDPEAFARRGQRVADAVEAADAAVVAAVDGAARGGGVELALACDVRYATPAATFAEPGVRFGLFGAWGGTVRLPRVMREGDALEFALSGRVVDAAEARRLGLVTRVVPEIDETVDALAAGDPDALRTIKRLLRDRRDDDARKEAEAAAFGDLVRAHAADITADRAARRETDDGGDREDGESGEGREDGEERGNPEE